jgi:hypothetical protein
VYAKCFDQRFADRAHRPSRTFPQQTSDDGPARRSATALSFLSGREGFGRLAHAQNALPALVPAHEADDDSWKVPNPLAWLFMNLVLVHGRWLCQSIDLLCNACLFHFGVVNLTPQVFPSPARSVPVTRNDYCLRRC